MKKIIGILSITLLPVVTFAQNYGYRMMNNRYESNGSAWGFFLLLLLPIIWVCFIVGVFVFWIIMLIDAIKHSPEKTKIVWIIVIIFTHIIGALIYYFVEKRPRHRVREHNEHKEGIK